MHLVMNVTGTTGCDVDLTWVSASPAAGTTVPAATTAVTVTFDSTGLVQGATYTGGLCVESNDPDTPVVLVPLTLEVDGMDFSDGFETGDASRWSASIGFLTRHADELHRGRSLAGPAAFLCAWRPPGTPCHPLAPPQTVPPVPR